jgi:hypothetical protein
MFHAMQTMLCLLSQCAPRCGLHDLVGHHGGNVSAPDPEMQAFVVTVLLIFVSAVVVLLFCCPFLAIRIRRIRDLFWVIPSVNLALYLLSISLRAYPGGFIARFQPPSLWFTLVEVFLVLVLSLFVACLNACAMWVIQRLRRRGGTRTMKSNQTDTWPFDQPRNCATFTMRQVLDGSEPILLVSHSADDHGWQFIGTSDASMADAKLVCLEHIVRLDPTVLEVANLPPGWQAIREHVGGAWMQREHLSIPEDER